MNKEAVEHLANLARIRLSEKELERLPQELESIMSYVSTVTTIAGDEGTTEPLPGSRYNIFRSDEVTNQPDQYTEVLLAEMPDRKGRFLQVKKILGGTQ